VAKFPEFLSVPYSTSENIRLLTKTLFSEFDDVGEEQRKQKWLYPRRNVTLQYKGKSKADARTVWQFYLSRNGPFEAFNFFSCRSDTYEGEYAAVGDGSTTIFNLPAKNSSNYTVYKNGIEQSGGGVDYTFSAGGGTDGADKITFVGAPDAGDKITYDFTGNLKVRCVFAEDYQDYETFYDRFVNLGIVLRGLLNK